MKSLVISIIVFILLPLSAFSDSTKCDELNEYTEITHTGRGLWGEDKFTMHLEMTGAGRLSYYFEHGPDKSGYIDISTMSAGIRDNMDVPVTKLMETACSVNPKECIRLLNFLSGKFFLARENLIPSPKWPNAEKVLGCAILRVSRMAEEIRQRFPLLRNEVGH